MSFGLIIVGDELLRGKRQDRHLGRVVEMLAARGLELAWAQILGDDMALLEERFRTTLASDDVVLSTGGIGATPDDLTREAVARAADVGLALHPEGEQILRERFAERATPQRMKMVEFPQGARLIPNPVNRIPGFSLGDHHFVPGFPNMAWPMLEWVLDTYYTHLQDDTAKHEYSYKVLAPESELIPVMKTLLAIHTQVKVSSLPSTERHGEVELSVRGPAEQADAAAEQLTRQLSADGLEWRLLDGAPGD
ncbi:MAG: molybdopterin-binding protein [Gammaproteobacteria bacterium]|nr:molybdopterin-binding protein [Gammaproteobacteria bacterium]